MVRSVYTLVLSLLAPEIKPDSQSGWSTCPVYFSAVFSVSSSGLVQRFCRDSTGVGYQQQGLWLFSSVPLVLPQHQHTGARCAV